MKKHAILSDDQLYRYSLTRKWGEGKKVLFIGLNPSTADAYIDDPTVIRCIGFAQTWGYEGIEIVNLFAYRATDPSGMRASSDPIGPMNDQYIIKAAKKCAKIIACWGGKGNLLNREHQVKELLGKYQLYALKINNDNSPAHPLYQRADTIPIIFNNNANKEVF